MVRGSHHTEDCRKRVSNKMKLVVFTEEHRRKISEAKIGTHYTNTEKMGQGMKGRIFTEEHREKLSQAQKRVGNKPPILIGEKNNHWKGGITPALKKIRLSMEMKLWREVVFKRDDYTCRECGKRGIALEAHHIQPFAYYPDKRFELSNGLTLCKDCHNKTKTKASREKTRQIIEKEGLFVPIGKKKKM